MFVRKSCAVRCPSVDESAGPREMITLVTVPFEKFDNSINVYFLIHVLRKQNFEKNLDSTEMLCFS